MVIAESVSTGVFDRRFEELCGYAPYPWQRRVYDDFLSGRENWPSHITAPTGAGKTNLMAVWLLALIAEAERGEEVRRIPRRLVWVVNRRVVVDQATETAERLASSCKAIEAFRVPLLRLAKLDGSGIDPLAVSTLRGEKADNREWRKDPARAAIIEGTVDMIGSRLLFRGYGDGLASRPQHAALLGQDALIVNDEAHLTPAFAKLLTSVKDMQGSSGLKPFQVLELTATPAGDTKYPESFVEDLAHSETFRRRFEAKKNLHLVHCADRKSIHDKMLELALAEGAIRTIVFFRSPKDVQSFAADLEKKGISGERIALITGTQRGFERDELARSNKMRVFLEQEGPEQPYFLIATSAGEVGIDATSDRLITTLDSAESLLQRFGRLKRFGEGGEGNAYVVYTEPKEKDVELHKSLEFLRQLPDVSAQTLFGNCARPAPKQVRTAPLEDWLVDRWSMTSIRDGTPKVADYLHGLQESEEPRTVLVWRDEISYLMTSGVDPQDLEKALRVHRILAREKVDVPQTEALAYLEHLASLKTLPNESGERIDAEKIQLIVEDANGVAQVHGLKALVERAKKPGNAELAYATLWLESRCCYLRNGMLSLDSKETDGERDVAEIPGDQPGERARFVYREDEEGARLERLGKLSSRAVEEFNASDSELADWRESLVAEGWRIMHEVTIPQPENPDATVLLVYAKKSKETGTPQPVMLADHVKSVIRHATRLGEALSLPKHYRDAIRLAAEVHDEGKKSCIFRRALGCTSTEPLAKSGRRGKLGIGGIRHELSSLRNGVCENDLVAHLIAAHHGHGRPHFDPSAEDAEFFEFVCGQRKKQPRRFGQLQTQYGHWNLAYLEAILRAADWLASEEEQLGHE